MQILWAIAVLAMIGTIGTVAVHRHDCRLRSERAGVDPDECVDYFTQLGVPRSVAEIVRAFFQDWKGIAGFPVLPTDNIADVYGIVDEDVDDTLFELAELCGRRDKPEEGELGCPTIVTIEDMVTLVAQVTTPQKCEIVPYDDAVDREGRYGLARLLRRFATGRITNLELERGINEIPWNGTDGAIPGLVHDVRTLLNVDTRVDLSDESEYNLSYRCGKGREIRHALARRVMFLYSDLPYRWRWQKGITVREAWIVVSMLVVFAGVAYLGYFWQALPVPVLVLLGVYRCVRSGPKSQSANEEHFFPFANCVHFLAARWRPHLLNGPIR